MSLKRLKPLASREDGSNECRPAKRSCGLFNASDPKPKYFCDDCGLPYMNSSSLGRHKVEKHGPPRTTHGCPHCGKRFVRPDGVKKHINENICPYLRGDLTRRQQSSSDSWLASPLHRSPSSITKAANLSLAYPDRLPETANLHSAYTWYPEHTTTSPPCGLPSADASRTTFVPPPHSFSDPVPSVPYLSGRSNPSFASTSSSLDDIRLSSRPPPFSIVYLPFNFEDWRRGRLERAKSDLSELLVDFEYLPRHLSNVRFHWGYPIPPYDDWRYRQQQERRERDKSRCTRPRPPSKSPLPPAFDLPPQQDLEYLISQQSRMRRRLHVMDSFQMRHCRFVQHALDQMSFVPQQLWNNRILRHTINIKQAWKDGVDAAQRLLSGTLPRQLHSVLGVAQLASAIRSAMNRIESPVASEERFLCDLSRWRQLLPSDFHAAFDYHADMLWDNRPPSETAWQESHDAETLVYFQDMLAEMLSHIECSPPERAKLGCALPPPGKASRVSSVATPSLDLSGLARGEALHEDETMMELPSHDNSKHTTLSEFSLYSAGAIFALILAYLLSKPQ